MSGILETITGSLGTMGLWVLKKATPKIFASLVEKVEAWHQECLETENQIDDVFSGIVLTVVQALAGTKEAQADPDSDDDSGSGEDDGSEEDDDADPSTEAAAAGA